MDAKAYSTLIDENLINPKLRICAYSMKMLPVLASSPSPTVDYVTTSNCTVCNSSTTILRDADPKHLCSAGVLPNVGRLSPESTALAPHPPLGNRLPIRKGGKKLAVRCRVTILVSCLESSTPESALPEAWLNRTISKTCYTYSGTYSYSDRS